MMAEDGADDGAANIEFGCLQASGGIAQPLAEVQILASETGLIEGVNPVTGEETDGIDWRLIADFSIVTAYGNFDSIFGVSKSSTTALTLQMDVSQYPYYYAMYLTSDFDTLNVYFTPTSFTFIPLPA